MVGWVHVWAEAVLVRCMQGRQAFSGQPACEGIMEMDLVELNMWRKVWHRAIYSIWQSTASAQTFDQLQHRLTCSRLKNRETMVA